MDCDEAQVVMTLYLIDDPSLTTEQRADFENHLLGCPGCNEEFQETWCLISVLKGYGSISDDTRELLEQNGYSTSPQPSMTVEEGWEDLKQRLPDLAQLEKQQKRKKFIIRLGKVAALAASIVLAVTLGWLVAGPYIHHNMPVPSQAARSIAFAELITPSGKHPLPLGKPVTTADDRQEVLLGGIHRVVMNHKTEVSFDAETIGNKAAYKIQLTQGELYVEVVPGHPFTVKTPNARLNITGTRFDVRYDQNRTDLALVKGSIQFVNTKNSWTNVIAGYSSVICGQAPPTAPAQTNALAISAWAKDTALQNALARVQPVTTQEALLKIQDLNMAVAPPKLDTLDYADWMKTKRDWFQREFPWIFKTEKVLNEQGVQTDYITLLMVSGNIWQFRYPCPSNQPMAVLYAADLKRIAAFYHIDPAILAGILPQTTSSQKPQPYQDALNCWQQDIKQIAGQGQMPAEFVFFTLRATTYLGNTQTAIYLWIKTHPELAQRLMADRAYASTYLAAVFSQAPLTLESWMKETEEKVSVIRTANSLNMELFTTPPASDCSSQLRELALWLREEVLSLMPGMQTKDVSAGGTSR